MSVMHVSPAKAKAALARRLAEDERYKRWKESNQPLPTPGTAVQVENSQPASSPTPATARQLYRRDGRQIHVPIENAPEFERAFGFVYGGLVETVRMDGGDDFFFKGTFETRPE